MSLQQKLKKVPSPIKEMIEEAAEEPIKECDILSESFKWFDNKVFKDIDFWEAVHCEIEGLDDW